MPWTYHQRSGELVYRGQRVATGYSGRGEHKNDPNAQHIPSEGPLPRGWYTIGVPFSDEHMGPYVLGLEPDKGNEMHGRSGFCVHGDNASAPGTASRGCIILGRSVRVGIWESGDRSLQVVE